MSVKTLFALVASSTSPLVVFPSTVSVILSTCAPGSTVTRTVTNLDWLPTLLAMAGVEVPADAVVRGRDIGPLLRGESVEWNDDLYGEYSMHHGSRTHMRMIRTPEWKLMIDLLHPGRGELYHLAEDPGEQANLYGAKSALYQRIQGELRERILEKMREIEDPVLATIEASDDRTP